ncbi:MAG TPA: exosome complex protein Rrp42 [Thermoplasmata archaeon]|nr:exosome complex protein Rrp42 [Thermoplasmata archaeon]
MNNPLISSLKKDYLNKLAQQNKRIDGRAFNEYRKLTIEAGLVRKAEGSARVKIGNTQVLTGVKLDVGEPYPDSPESGVLTTSAELIPLASPDFEAGPPREDAIELARVVDRGVRESEVIDLEKLCIEPGEKVWIVFVDIHVLDYDGNLFDASSLAALAALATAKVPAERFELGEDYPLPMKEPPISCTFVKFNGAIVVDPCLDEETIAEARLTVATDKQGTIRAMQKGLAGSFTIDEVKKIIKYSIDNGARIRKILEETIRRDHGEKN